MQFDAPSRKSSDRSSGPHPDMDKNSTHFIKVLNNVIFLIQEDDLQLRLEVQDSETVYMPKPWVGDIRTKKRVKEFLCCNFYLKDRCCYYLSFQEPHDKFSRNLSSTLNAMKEKGYLRRTTWADDGGEWGRGFV